MWCAAYVYDYEGMDCGDVYPFSSEDAARKFIAEQPRRRLPGRWVVWRGVMDTKEPFADAKFD